MTHAPSSSVGRRHAGETNFEPLVSIILPVYNGESFIASTLESALGQTYRHIEVIVVDDGSRDRTRAIVDARAVSDSRVRVVGQANRGVTAARNRAISLARGEFIAPLDADDLWDPTKIERQVRRMTDAGESTGLVYCWWVWIDLNGAVLSSSPRWRIEGDAPETLVQVNYIGSASVPLFRRRYLDEIGGYDATLCEGCVDWDASLKVAERSSVAVVPCVLVAYRRHRGSMSTETDRMWRSHALVMKGARQRRPELSTRAIRHSQNQFALHLAGVCFLSGAYARAIGWGIRALPSRLALQVLPYAIQLFLKTLLRRGRLTRRVIRPGVCFSDLEMPQPLMPYDVIYRRR